MTLLPRTLAGQLILATGLCASGCSLGTVQRTACASNTDCEVFEEATRCASDGYCVVPAEGSCEETADCRREVGFGSTCVEGLCEDAVAVARCQERTFPADLLTKPQKHRDRLVFGMLMDRSAGAHVQRENSVELAVSQINGQRGIDGREFGMVFCDVQGGEDSPFDDGLTRTDAAVANAQWLAETLQVPAIIGPASSGDTTRVYTEVIQPTDGRCLAMTPSGTSPSLTNLDPPGATDKAPGLLWRSAPSATQQGEVIAGHMGERTDVKISNVAILHEEAAFGEAVALAFGEVFTDRFSGNFRLFGFIAGDEDDLKSQVAAVGQALGDYQAVLVLGQVNEMRVFMTAATEDTAYSDDIPLYFGDTGGNAEIFTGTSDTRLFDNVLAAVAQPPESFVYKAYSDAFMSRFGGVDPGDSSFTSNSYDALWLLALGSTWATYLGDGVVDAEGRHEVDGINIARGLRKTVGGKSQIRFIKTEWPGAVAQFMAGRAIDVVGASGNHDWDLRSEEAPGPTALLQADAKGEFEIVTLVE